MRRNQAHRNRIDPRELVGGVIVLILGLAALCWLVLLVPAR